MHATTTSAPALAEITDEEIIERVRAGETPLFELVMRRHNRRIFRAARAILRDDVEAEDVMQDAYVRAYAHLHEFEGRSAFSTWLTRIAVHEALARRRRERRFQRLGVQRGEASVATAASPEKEAGEREMSALLDSAIDALSAEHRVVFVLRAVEEMSGAETAECLGIPEETVKTRLFRARARLQEALRTLETGWATTSDRARRMHPEAREAKNDSLNGGIANDHSRHAAAHEDPHPSRFWSGPCSRVRDAHPRSFVGQAGDRESARSRLSPSRLR